MLNRVASLIERSGACPGSRPHHRPSSTECIPLAEPGLGCSNMHTIALCSPGRSCVVTGRNHHKNAIACITEGAAGYPATTG